MYASRGFAQRASGGALRSIIAARDMRYGMWVCMGNECMRACHDIDALMLCEIRIGWSQT